MEINFQFNQLSNTQEITYWHEINISAQLTINVYLQGLKMFNTLNRDYNAEAVVVFEILCLEGYTFYYWFSFK